MAENRVVVLGGGVGGLVAANQLRKRLSNEHQVVVVERNPRHYFAPSFPWLAMGTRKADHSEVGALPSGTGRAEAAVAADH